MSDFLASCPADLSEWERDGRLVTRGFVHPWRSSVAAGNGESFFDTYVRSVLSVLGPDTVVLDVGCGHGSYALSLAPLCRRVIGVDRDGGALELGRELAVERGIDNVDFVPVSFGSSGADSGASPAVELDEPVDLFVCRRGPVLGKWLSMAYLLGAPDAALIGIHPTGDPVVELAGLPDALRSGRSFGFDEVRDWVVSAVDADDGPARLHGCWWFDVPERFDDLAELYARLPAGKPDLEHARPSLEAVFAQHGGSVEVRHRRLVWRVDLHRPPN